MNSKAVSCTFVTLICLAGQIQAAEPEVNTYLPISEMLGMSLGQQPQPPAQKKAPDLAPAAPPPLQDIFAQPPSTAADAGTGFTPHMIGDFPGIFGTRTITVPAVTNVQTTTVTKKETSTGIRVTALTGTTTQAPTTATRTLLVPDASRGGFNIGENESPRPQDRVFLTYNYFGDLSGPNNGSSNPILMTPVTATTSQKPIPGTSISTTTASTVVVPGVATPTANLDRELFGFEKTFLGGYASIEVRLPLLQQSSNDGFGANDVGDVTIIGKYAFLLDRITGNVFSGGFAVTAPTGPSIPTIDGNFRSTILQPFIGYIWNFDRFYIQGFNSVAVPNEARDVTIMFNDLSVNYWLYRADANRFLTAVIPTLEAHVTTPLNNRSINDPIYVPDIVAITGGLHFGLGKNTTLTFGVVTPVTGPRVFTVEALTQLNIRF